MSLFPLPNAAVEIDQARRALRQSIALASSQSKYSEHIIIDVNAAGDTTLVQSSTGKLIEVWSVFIWSSAAVTLEFRDGAARLVRISSMQPTTGFLLPFAQAEPWFVCSQGSPFVLNCDVAAPLDGYVKYRLVNP